MSSSVRPALEQNGLIIPLIAYVIITWPKRVIPMTKYAKPIDVTTSTELQRLAEQVQQTRQAIPLTRDNQVVAVVRPVPTRKLAREAEPSPSPTPYYPTLESLAGA